MNKIDEIITKLMNGEEVDFEEIELTNEDK